MAKLHCFYYSVETMNIPSKLDFRIESYPPVSSCRGVYLNDNDLLVYNSFFENLFPSYEYWTKVPEPSQEMWDQFYNILSDINVKKWDKRYEERLLDGYGWIFRIRFRDIHRTIKGFNSSPSDIFICGARVNPLDELVYAINELTSGIYNGNAA